MYGQVVRTGRATEDLRVSRHGRVSTPASSWTTRSWPRYWSVADKVGGIDAGICERWLSVIRTEGVCRAFHDMHYGCSSLTICDTCFVSPGNNMKQAQVGLAEVVLGVCRSAHTHGVSNRRQADLAVAGAARDIARQVSSPCSALKKRHWLVDPCHELVGVAGVDAL